MRYRFIQAEKAAYPVEVLCRVLSVARSGYYAWCRRPLGARAQQNQWLVTHIRTCYQASRGPVRMGVRGFIRICAPTGCGSAAIAWLGSCGCMGSAVFDGGAGAHRPARFPQWCGRTSCDEPSPPHGRMSKWAADITYVPTRQGWLYLAVVIDLYSRRVVGWAMDAQQTIALTLTALEMALHQRPVLAWGPCNSSGSRQPVWRGGLSAPVSQLRNPGLDEPPRQLLGQCRRGELLCYVEDRADSPTAVCDSPRSPRRHL